MGSDIGPNESGKTYPQGPKAEKFLHNIQRSLLKSVTLLAG